MTPDSSFKANLRNAFSVFKWEMKNRATSLAVYGILSAVLTVVVLTLCIAVGVNTGADKAIQKAALIFQLVSSFGVFSLTAVFTIIYTAGNYSYLHNKRKVDMYGSLPISSTVLYLSKTASTFLFSIIPALFFFSVISIISLILGQPLVAETLELYVHIIIGTAACVAFYGLLAVCCGTTVHTVISFLAIAISYPMALNLIKAVVNAFFYGIPRIITRDNFIINALNPVGAYQGRNVIYWILFTAACTVFAAVLAKKRRSDRAQNSFAYFLPAYAVKLIVSFICGMSLGVLFGSLNALANGMLGFLFGFVLGSVPAYIIVHLIFYKNFDSLIKTSIPFAVMAAVTLAAVVICDVDILGFNTYVPSENMVESAGIVYPKDVIGAEKTIPRIASECSDDFSDAETIKEIIEIHQRTVEDFHMNSQIKFSNVWYNLFLDGFEEIIGSDSSYCIGYKLKNGTEVIRHYRLNLMRYIGSSDSSESYYEREKMIEEIVDSEQYTQNYFSIDCINRDMLRGFTLEKSLYSDKGRIVLAENEKVSAEKFKEDCQKLYDALKKDNVNLKENKSNYKNLKLRIIYDDKNRVQSSRLLHTIMQLSDRNNPRVYFTEDSVNTIRALESLGLINSDGEVNTDSPYYISYEQSER